MTKAIRKLGVSSETTISFYCVHTARLLLYLRKWSSRSKSYRTTEGFKAPFIPGLRTYDGGVIQESCGDGLLVEVCANC